MTDNSAPRPVVPASRVEPLDEFRALVRAAFEQALSGGKEHWDEMTTAVLKNRLLNLTQRQFSEARYGSPSFIHLVRRIPDLVDVIDDRPPFTLKLKTPITEQSAPSPIADSLPRPIDAAMFAALAEGDWRKVRIRDDLWNAVIDYASGNAYVLDPTTGIARPIEDTDTDLPIVPTLSAKDMNEWRQAFVGSLPAPTSERFQEQLQHWLEGRGRQSDLPYALRRPWADFVKRNVGTRLIDWFKDQGEFPPNDMFVESDTRTLPPAEGISEVVRTRQLRDLIIRAVRRMTYEELTEISLPAHVFLRITGSQSTHDS